MGEKKRGGVRGALKVKKETMAEGSIDVRRSESEKK